MFYNVKFCFTARFCKFLVLPSATFFSNEKEMNKKCAGFKMFFWEFRVKLYFFRKYFAALKNTSPVQLSTMLGFLKIQDPTFGTSNAAIRLHAGYLRQRHQFRTVG